MLLLNGLKIHRMNKRDFKMDEVTRYFHKPESERDCEGINCRVCVTMLDILMFPTYSWTCYKMEKAREFRKQASLKK